MGLSKLDQLYRQMILEHSKTPHHHGVLESGETYELKNPTCGDVIKLHVQIEGDKVIDASFTGEGCSISTASASMMCDAIIGKTIEEVDTMIQDFSSLVQGEEISNENLGDAEVLSGVSKFPARVKCATLSWKALQHLVDNTEESATIFHVPHEEEK